MAIVRPFASLRPRPDLAGALCELPYDVMSSEEARALAKDNPWSFLRVSKPEIDLPPGTDPYSPEVYRQGRRRLDQLRRDGALQQDREPTFYAYRQIMGRHAQTGIVALASCAEYQRGDIRKHELTRPDKEDDRVRHIRVLNAQTGPAFLAYRGRPEIDSLVEGIVAQSPATDFTAADGVRHTAWVVSEPAISRRLAEAFALGVPRLYIADGHHRSAAAYRVCEERQGQGGADGFLAVIFPQNQLQILPYNRVVKDLNGLAPADFIERLGAVGSLQDWEGVPPSQSRSVGLYMEGRWRRLTFRPTALSGKAAVDLLDVSLLQNLVLDPLLGIGDPRRSERIGFVGGIRGTGELERLVDTGQYRVAFALSPTGIEELLAVADAGGIMPPKSTWFEPKLRDGLFSHVLEPEA